MTVRFIFGRAGSGKTQACLEAIAKADREAPVGPPLILLAPEQATFQLEKELTARTGRATFRARVLSFDRLSKVFPGLQQKGTLPQLSEYGRQMVVHRLLGLQAGKLGVFADSGKRPKSSGKISAQLREFKKYAISADSLCRAAESGRISGQAGAKVRDLALLYRAYEEFISGRFIDPDDELTRLSEAVQRNGLPAETRIWVDGFSGFTGQEYLVLEALMHSAVHLETALCLDPRGAHSGSTELLFHQISETLNRLRQIARASGIAELSPVFMPKKKKLTRFAGSPALALVESSFAVGYGRPLGIKSGDVMLATAANRRAEAEAAARDIRHKVREYGWRYKDMAVVLRSLDDYRDIIAAVFLEHEVPFFIDRKITAAHHPLVELLRCALTAAQNPGGEALLQMLKTDLFGLPRETIDRLENYVLACGVQGTKWLEREIVEDYSGDRGTGKGASRYLAAVNKGRERLAQLFIPFYNEINSHRGQGAAKYCRAIYNFLARLEAAATLQSWSEADRDRGALDLSQRHRAVWQEVIRLLEQAELVFGEQVLSLQDFAEILQAGLDSVSCGQVPLGLDQVIVGEVEHSRQPDLKAVYVLGLCDGEFPARQAEEGLFSDRERGELGELGLKLAAGRRQRLLYEHYLAYIALTRSSHFLFASCPLADEEGKTKRASQLFQKLRRLFPHNEVHHFGVTPWREDDAHYLAGENRTAANLLLAVRESAGNLSPLWSAAYQQALLSRGISERMRVLWPALTGSNLSMPLTGETVRALYGGILYSSISRLEEFARCPFAHYARFGLRLARRKELTVTAPDIGTFYHDALHQFACELQERGCDWGDLTTDEAAEIMSGVADRLLVRLHGGLLLSTGRLRHHAAQHREILVRAARLLTLHARHGSFRTVGVEVPFVTETGNLSLSGRIDRIDTAEGEEGRYLRIVDYKSSNTELQMSDVWHGLSLQLPAYLSAALQLQQENIRARPAGAFCFILQNATVRINNPPEKETNMEGLRLSGVLLGEREAFTLSGGAEYVPASLRKDGGFTRYSRIADAKDLQTMLDYSVAKLEALADNVLSGCTEVKPYLKKGGERACRYCEFAAVCRLDRSAGGSFRKIDTYESGQALDLMKCWLNREDRGSDKVDG